MNANDLRSLRKPTKSSDTSIYQHPQGLACPHMTVSIRSSDSSASMRADTTTYPSVGILYRPSRNDNCPCVAVKLVAGSDAKVCLQIVDVPVTKSLPNRLPCSLVRHQAKSSVSNASPQDSSSRWPFWSATWRSSSSHQDCLALSTRTGISQRPSMSLRSDSTRNLARGGGSPD